MCFLIGRKELIISTILLKSKGRVKEELARTMTKEMGKVIKEARSEVEKCVRVMDYCADNGKVFITDEVITTDKEIKASITQS